MKNIGYILALVFCLVMLAVCFLTTLSLIVLKAITIKGVELLSLIGLLLLITIFILFFKIKNNLSIGHILGLFGSIFNLIILSIAILIGQGLDTLKGNIYAIIVFSSVIISLIITLFLLFSKMRTKINIAIYGTLIGYVFLTNLIIPSGMYLSGIPLILLSVSLIYFIYLYNRSSTTNN